MENNSDIKDLEFEYKVSDEIINDNNNETLFNSLKQIELNIFTKNENNNESNNENNEEKSTEMITIIYRTD